MMQWLLLLIAISFVVAGTASMKLSDVIVGPYLAEVPIRLGRKAGWYVWHQ